MMNRSIKWLKYSVGIIVLIVSIISVFNYKLDSLGLFGNSTHVMEAAKAITSNKMIAGLKDIDERFFQEQIIKNLQVKNNVIALGSSKIMLLRKRFFLEEKVNFFNHGVSGATLEDYIAIVGMYELMHGYLPSTVMLGIDPWIFNVNNAQTRWKTISKYYSYEVGKIYNKKEEETNNVNAPKWKQLINYDYTISNIKHMQASIEHDLQGFYITDRIDIDDSIRETDGSIHYPYKLRYPNYEEVDRAALSSTKGNVYSMNNYKNLDNIELFEDFINYLQLNDVSVIFYLPPYHPIAYDLLTKNDEYKYLDISEKYLLKFSTEKNIELKGSYNPSKNNLNRKDFIDGMHGGESVVRNIFKPKN